MKHPVIFKKINDSLCHFPGHRKYINVLKVQIQHNSNCSYERISYPSQQENIFQVIMLVQHVDEIFA